MFLKTLTIKGFKSFADATTLSLEPGVTVVVGPNGSGKSNVVDAIAWVLGAMAPSAVRSQKMDDVIFAGSSKRAALGRAEVSLTLDNSAGVLPIEFSEVTITRTLFRSGDSEYAINGTSCRLLDIQELLSDTGVGRQQHVVVSQGQIDAVLNARPEDRRAIIEEAAGVLKFRKRREKSQRRLDATETNLTRISDLLREVRRQLRPLERQADAARRHGGIVAELTALRIFTAGREIEALQRRIGTSAHGRADLARQINEVLATLAKLDTEVIDAEAQLSAQGGHDIGDGQWLGARQHGWFHADLLRRVQRAVRCRRCGSHPHGCRRRRRRGHPAAGRQREPDGRDADRLELHSIRVDHDVRPGGRGDPGGEHLLQRPHGSPSGRRDPRPDRCHRRRPRSDSHSGAIGRGDPGADRQGDRPANLDAGR